MPAALPEDVFELDQLTELDGKTLYGHALLSSSLLWITPERIARQACPDCDTAPKHGLNNPALPLRTSPTHSHEAEMTKLLVSLEDLIDRFFDDGWVRVHPLD